jgi:hypothetical protein
MEKTNTNNYNTPYSKVYNFKNFNADTEIKDLGKTKRSFVKNYDDVYELPNNKKMYFNKVTKTMQSLSKDEIDDKIEAIEDMEEKKESVTLLRFGQIINENKLEKELKELESKLKNLLDEEPKNKEEKDELKELIKETEKEINKIKIDLQSE